LKHLAISGHLAQICARSSAVNIGVASRRTAGLADTIISPFFDNFRPSWANLIRSSGRRTMFALLAADLRLPAAQGHALLREGVPPGGALRVARAHLDAEGFRRVRQAIHTEASRLAVLLARVPAARLPQALERAPPAPAADGEHIVVANDNNLPYSAGRKPNVQDDSAILMAISGG
jgi:hypothetical protein